MSLINDESLLLEFVVESREHLSTIEPDLLVLERDGKRTDPEIINRVFRAIHSIKGASGFFGLESLKTLSHSMESTLMLMRDGVLSPTNTVMDPLLVGVDRLRLMLEDIGKSEDVVFQDVVAELDALMTHSQIVDGEDCSQEHQTNNLNSEPEAQQIVFQPNSHLVESAVQNGQKLYAIQIFTDIDLVAQARNPVQFLELMMSTGTVLDSSLDISTITGLDNALNEPLSLEILFSSVLELELLAMAFNLPEQQFRQVDISAIFSDSNKDNQQNSTTSKMVDISCQDSPIAEPIQTIPLIDNPLPAPPEAKITEVSIKPVVKSKAGNSDSVNESIRVKVDLLNQLMDLAGELVLTRNQLIRAFESIDNKEHMGLSGIIQTVNLVTSDLQEHIMQTRMQPISSIFGKFPRVIRDLSRILGKEIELQMIGEDVELDKSILESLSDPLTHLIRNCCDHGMETPDIREAAGKSRQGTVLLKAYQESGHINIAVIDDGAGIDHERVAAKALEKGLITENSLRQMSVQEKVNLIFAPGFSMAEKITDVSGRGVGMDVVRTNIEQIGGTITIETERGKGTTILLRLPLTLAIFPALVISSANQIFTIPQINLVELVCVQATQMATQIEKVGSASVLRLRGKLLPLITLSTVLEIDPYPIKKGASSSLPGRHRENSNGQATDRVEEGHSTLQRNYNIVVLKYGNTEYGLIVDDIKDIEEIVVKPLSQFIKNCKCFSGATIMGDGRVAIVLDVSGLVAISGLSFSEINAEEERRTQEATPVHDSNLSQEKQAILLFNSATTENFAIPLSDILRLEKFSMDKVETIGCHKFLPYHGKSISLIFLNDYLPVSPVSIDLKDAFLILPTCGIGKTGIVATNIIDAIDENIHLEETLVQHLGISGTAVINDHITLFINAHRLLESVGSCKDETRSTEWQAEHFQPSC